MSNLHAFLAQLRPGTIISGPSLPERVRLIEAAPMGASLRLVAEGLETSRLYRPILSLTQLAELTVAETGRYDGDPQRFRLGVEAMRLGLAYEYDRFFALSIARIDPLPHQLEAVYDYFLKLPRIRFLLADDPGAGKTIMAGLLIKELKIRGLIQRVLILTPANLTFQWQRELADKFREPFEVIRGDVLRASYGSNPWQERHQVITSVAWVSRVDDARESLLRSSWDLVIVDEAHKMSAAAEDQKTLAYQLGERLGELTDHYLLMTATPHKGDPEHFRLFLKLLDPDVYADVASIETAIAQRAAPFYLRRVKEALVTFPEPQSGQTKRLFTRREVRTIPFQIDAEEWDFYDALTRYVEEQSIQVRDDSSARGRAVGFTMAMLQRRFASSVYAVRRSLERMLQRREQILADPAAYRQAQIERRLPDDFDDLTEEEQQRILDDLEAAVASVDPDALRREIAQLTSLIRGARDLEAREVEPKLVHLRQQLTAHAVFADPQVKLLLFTEHKDTLDYLVAKLREWKLSVTQIHGGMKVGDRQTPGTRIYAEWEFRERCQVLVATEAAGEGINLQFCWLLINYDIPWNPVRLEQRMGRVHRYGQERDCLIINFAATNTREGRVLHKLLERVREIERALDPHQTGKVFNVLGEVLPANQLERMLRDMYAHNQTEEVILNRIVEQVEPERFRRITASALEGLARRSLNLAALIDQRAEAQARRLVPEVVRDFFLEAARLADLQLREVGRGRGGTGGPLYRVGRVPRPLQEQGERLVERFGALGREYPRIVFDRAALQADPTLEWVTPGHPLFEALRAHITALAQSDMERGTRFYDLHRDAPARLDVFSAAITDGRGQELHRRLLIVETAPDGTLHLRQPTIFLDGLVPAPPDTPLPDETGLPGQDALEQELILGELEQLLAEVAAERSAEVERVAEHVEISLNAIIDRQQIRFAELMAQRELGDDSPLLAANLKTTEDRLDQLTLRLERRRRELRQERACTISDIRHHGRAWVLPHPQRNTPALAPMVRDAEVEQIAVRTVTAHLEAQGWQVQSVEAENLGFDLIARRPDKAAETRFVEVKGRAGVGQVALTRNEFQAAQRLQQTYWLYVVYHCAVKPELHAVQNPARLDWEPVVQVEHYRVDPRQILEDQEL